MVDGQDDADDVDGDPEKVNDVMSGRLEGLVNHCGDYKVFILSMQSKTSKT